MRLLALDQLAFNADRSKLIEKPDRQCVSFACFGAELRMMVLTVMRWRDEAREQITSDRWLQEILSTAEIVAGSSVEPIERHVVFISTSTQNAVLARVCCRIVVSSKNVT